MNFIRILYGKSFAELPSVILLKLNHFTMWDQADMIPDILESEIRRFTRNSRKSFEDSASIFMSVGRRKIAYIITKIKILIFKGKIYEIVNSIFWRLVTSVLLLIPFQKCDLNDDEFTGDVVSGLDISSCDNPKLIGIG